MPIATEDGNPTFIANDAQIQIHERIRLERDIALVTEGFLWTYLITFRRYANGHHAIILTEKQKKILSNLLAGQFCDNICHQIIHEANGRLEFQKYECKNGAVKNWADEFFAVTKVKGRQGDIHYSTLRDGNYAVATNWDAKKKRVQWYKEPWWNGIAGVYIHYDETDEPDYAVKEWQEKDASGATLYRRLIWFEDHLERWSSINNVDGWKLSPLPEDNGVWPLPWLDENKQPMGIPYTHFANGARFYGNYGVSELDGGVIGFQDQLVDAQFSLTATSRLTGYQQYYATGVKPRKKTGTEEVLPIVVEPGAFHQTENDKAKFGRLEAGDISQLITSYNLKLKRVAQMTSTPVHIITGGDWPSGEAILRAELPAVSKAKRQINTLSDCWVEILTNALKIWNKYNPSQKINYDVKDGIIEAVFGDPERRDAVSRSIVVHNLGPNISKAEALRIMEYPEERVQEVVAEMQADEQASADAMVSAMASRPQPQTNDNKQATGSGTSNRSSGESGGGK